MATPLEILNSQPRRAPVAVYAPGRRTAQAPMAPRTGPQRTARPRAQQDRGVDWVSLANKVTNTPAAQKARQERAEQAAKAEAEDQAGFWGTDFGKGLGFAINNPVTRAALMPINYLQTGGRAVTLGFAEGTKALNNAPGWFQGIVKNIPVGVSSVGSATNAVDMDRLEADKRSNFEKVFSPNSTYGVGELLHDFGPDATWQQQWLNRVAGFSGDVMFDPLTYVGGGATRVIEGASHIDEAADALRIANQSLRAAEEAGDAAQVTKAAQRVAAAESYAERAASMPPVRHEVPLPPTRKGRADLIGELSLTPSGNKLVNEFGPELARGAQRGLQTMPTAVKEALQISEPGLRLRGFGTKIPGTGKVADLLNRGGGAARAGISHMPGMNSKLANIRVAKGLEDAYATLTRGRAGDIETAALDIGVRNEIQAGSGAFTARANRVLVKAVRDTFKKNSETENRALMAAAEEAADPNEINALFARILDVYQRSTGRILDERFLKDPNTYVPHKLDPKFRRVLADMSKNGDKAAEDFLREGGFYKDDLLEGSGFLERSRKLQPNDDGTPRVLKIGDREVTIDSDSINGLNTNRSLREAFPNYEGNFYDDDPARIAEAYIGSLSRQAGRDRAVKKLLGSGTKKVTTMTGALDETRRSIDEALRLQREGALLDTTRGGYRPGLPVPDVPVRPTVPGSALDLRMRGEVAAGRVPEHAPAERFGDVNPEDFFVTTKSETATTARRDEALGPSRAYAKAAEKDVAAVDKMIREGLYDIRDTMAKSLRGTIKEQTAQIKAWNAQFRKLSDRLKALGPLTSENIDELSLLNNKLEAEILDAETKLKRTSASWKGRATRAKRKVEADLRTSLENLKRLRDDAAANAKRAPETMQAEWEKRTAALNEPVRDAMKKVLAKEQTVPVPHPQHVVDEAQRVVDTQFEKGAAVDAVERQKERYRSYLEQIDEINQRRNANGKLSPADQRKMRDLVERTDNFRGVLRRQAEKAPKNVDPYAEAQRELADLNRRAEAAAPTPTATAGRPPYPFDDVVPADRSPTWWRNTRDVLSEGLGESIDETSPAFDNLDNIFTMGDADTEALIRDTWDLLPDRHKNALRSLGWENGLPPGAPEQLALGAGSQDPILDSIVDSLGGAPRSSGRTTAGMPNPETFPGIGGPQGQLDDLTMEDIFTESRHAVDTPLVDMVGEGNLDQIDAVAALSDEQFVSFVDRMWDKLPPETRAQLETLGWQRGPAPTPAVPTGGLTAAEQARRRSLQRQFQSGGKFAERRRSEKILKEMREYHAKVKAATVNERKALAQAEYAKAQRQEAIIWANRSHTMRHFGEDEGFEFGRMRTPEGIETPPQPESRAETVLKQGRGRVHVPRAEQEALASLSSRATYGGTGEQAARTQAHNLERQVRGEEATIQNRVFDAREQVAAEIGAKADAELGPMAAEAETFKNLAEDMTKKTTLVVKRDDLRTLRDRLRKADPSYRKLELHETIDEIEAVAKANPLLDDDKLAQTESILNTHRAELDRIDDTKFRAKELRKAADDAASGRLGDVMIAALNENWRALKNTGPLNTGDIIMDAELYKRFTNLFELSKEPKLLGRTFNAFTNMFKTYATLSPGFHVRNTIGGIFMNTSDGVTLAHQFEGAVLWQRYMKRGDDWLESQPRRIRAAFDATFASGAGGRYEEAGTAARSSNKALDKAMSNMFTRGGQRWGSRVEGGLRLGMALDSITNGQTIDQAFSRISRVHFNYAAVSQLDETMKRIIPFWTFMSRNLPLQIQQMWTNPRAYSYYDHLVSNFSLPDEEFTPEYWTRQGAWRTPFSIAGSPVYAQPDLGFTRVESDIKMLGNAAGGDFSQLFSQANPAIGATTDFLMKKDSFYDRNYDDTDYKKMSGPIGTPMTWVAKMLGQTNEAGQVSENFANYVSSLVPPINQAMRLAPASTGAERGGVDTLSKWMRYAGAPTQILTPAAQDSEYWNQWFAMQDEFKRQQAMAREAAS